MQYQYPLKVKSEMLTSDPSVFAELWDETRTRGIPPSQKVNVCDTYIY